jgi:hypothetical protein
MIRYILLLILPILLFSNQALSLTLTTPLSVFVTSVDQGETDTAIASDLFYDGTTQLTSSSNLDQVSYSLTGTSTHVTLAGSVLTMTIPSGYSSTATELNFSINAIQISSNTTLASANIKLLIPNDQLSDPRFPLASVPYDTNASSADKIKLRREISVNPIPTTVSGLSSYCSDLAVDPNAGMTPLEEIIVNEYYESDISPNFQDFNSPVYSGTLPIGLSIDSSTGIISGYVSNSPGIHTLDIEAVSEGISYPFTYQVEVVSVASALSQYDLALSGGTSNAFDYSKISTSDPVDIIINVSHPSVYTRIIQGSEICKVLKMSEYIDDTLSSPPPTSNPILIDEVEGHINKLLTTDLNSIVSRAIVGASSSNFSSDPNYSFEEFFIEKNELLELTQKFIDNSCDYYLSDDVASFDDFKQTNLYQNNTSTIDSLISEVIVSTTNTTTAIEWKRACTSNSVSYQPTPSGGGFNYARSLYALGYKTIPQTKKDYELDSGILLPLAAIRDGRTEERTGTLLMTSATSDPFLSTGIQNHPHIFSYELESLSIINPAHCSSSSYTDQASCETPNGTWIPTTCPAGSLPYNTDTGVSYGVWACLDDNQHLNFNVIQLAHCTNPAYTSQSTCEAITNSWVDESITPPLTLSTKDQILAQLGSSFTIGTTALGTTKSSNPSAKGYVLIANGGSDTINLTQDATALHNILYSEKWLRSSHTSTQTVCDGNSSLTSHCDNPFFRSDFLQSSAITADPKTKVYTLLDLYEEGFNWDGGKCIGDSTATNCTLAFSMFALGAGCGGIYFKNSNLSASKLSSISTQKRKNNASSDWIPTNYFDTNNNADCNLSTGDAVKADLFYNLSYSELSSNTLSFYLDDLAILLAPGYFFSSDPSLVGSLNLAQMKMGRYTNPPIDGQIEYIINDLNQIVASDKYTPEVHLCTSQGLTATIGSDGHTYCTGSPCGSGKTIDSSTGMCVANLSTAVPCPTPPVFSPNPKVILNFTPGNTIASQNNCSSSYTVDYQPSQPSEDPIDVVPGTDIMGYSKITGYDIIEYPANNNTRRYLENSVIDHLRTTKTGSLGYTYNNVVFSASVNGFDSSVGRRQFTLLFKTPGTYKITGIKASNDPQGTSTITYTLPGESPTTMSLGFSGTNGREDSLITITDFNQTVPFAISTNSCGGPHYHNVEVILEKSSADIIYTFEELIANGLIDINEFGTVCGPQYSLSSSRNSCEYSTNIDCPAGETMTISNGVLNCASPPENCSISDLLVDINGDFGNCNFIAQSSTAIDVLKSISSKIHLNTFLKDEAGFDSLTPLSVRNIPIPREIAEEISAMGSEAFVQNKYGEYEALNNVFSKIGGGIDIEKLTFLVNNRKTNPDYEEELTSFLGMPYENLPNFNIDVLPVKYEMFLRTIKDINIGVSGSIECDPTEVIVGQNSAVPPTEYYCASVKPKISKPLKYSWNPFIQSKALNFKIDTTANQRKFTIFGHNTITSDFSSGVVYNSGNIAISTESIIQADLSNEASVIKSELICEDYLTTLHQSQISSLTPYQLLITGQITCDVSSLSTTGSLQSFSFVPTVEATLQDDLENITATAKIGILSPNPLLSSCVADLKNSTADSIYELGLAIDPISGQEFELPKSFTNPTFSIYIPKVLAAESIKNSHITSQIKTIVSDLIGEVSITDGDLTKDADGKILFTKMTPGSVLFDNLIDDAKQFLALDISSNIKSTFPYSKKPLTTKIPTGFMKKAPFLLDAVEKTTAYTQTPLLSTSNFRNLYDDNNGSAEILTNSGVIFEEDALFYNQEVVPIATITPTHDSLEIKRINRVINFTTTPELSDVFDKSCPHLRSTASTGSLFVAHDVHERFNVKSIKANITSPAQSILDFSWTNSTKAQKTYYTNTSIISYVDNINLSTQTQGIIFDFTLDRVNTFHGAIPIDPLTPIKISINNSPEFDVRSGEAIDISSFITNGERFIGIEIAPQTFADLDVNGDDIETELEIAVITIKSEDPEWVALSKNLDDLGVGYYNTLIEDSNPNNIYANVATALYSYSDINAFELDISVSKVVLDNYTSEKTIKRCENQYGLLREDLITECDGAPLIGTTTDGCPIGSTEKLVNALKTKVTLDGSSIRYNYEPIVIDSLPPGFDIIDTIVSNGVFSAASLFACSEKALIVVQGTVYCDRSLDNLLGFTELKILDDNYADLASFTSQSPELFSLSSLKNNHLEPSEFFTFTSTGITLNGGIIPPDFITIDNSGITTIHFNSLPEFSSKTGVFTSTNIPSWMSFNSVSGDITIAAVQINQADITIERGGVTVSMTIRNIDSNPGATYEAVIIKEVSAENLLSFIEPLIMKNRDLNTWISLSELAIDRANEYSSPVQLTISVTQPPSSVDYDVEVALTEAREICTNFLDFDDDIVAEIREKSEFYSILKSRLNAQLLTEELMGSGKYPVGESIYSDKKKQSLRIKCCFKLRWSGPSPSDIRRDLMATKFAEDALLDHINNTACSTGGYLSTIVLQSGNKFCDLATNSIADKSFFQNPAYNFAPPSGKVNVTISDYKTELSNKNIPGYTNNGNKISALINNSIGTVKKFWIKKYHMFSVNNYDNLAAQVLRGIATHEQNYISQITGASQEKIISKCINELSQEATAVITNDDSSQKSIFGSNSNIVNLAAKVLPLSETEYRNLKQTPDIISVNTPTTSNITYTLTSTLTLTDSDALNFCSNILPPLVVLDNPILTFNNTSVIAGYDNQGKVTLNRALEGDYKNLLKNPNPNWFQEKICKEGYESISYNLSISSLQANPNTCDGSIYSTDCVADPMPTASGWDMIFSPGRVRRDMFNWMDNTLMKTAKVCGYTSNSSTPLASPEDFIGKSIFIKTETSGSNHIRVLETGILLDKLENDKAKFNIEIASMPTLTEKIMFPGINLYNTITNKKTGISRSISSMDTLEIPNITLDQPSEVEKLVNDCMDFKSTIEYKVPEQHDDYSYTQTQTLQKTYPNSSKDFSFKDPRSNSPRSVRECSDIFIEKNTVYMAKSESTATQRRSAYIHEFMNQLVPEAPDTIGVNESSVSMFKSQLELSDNTSGRKLDIDSETGEMVMKVTKQKSAGSQTLKDTDRMSKISIATPTGEAGSGDLSGIKTIVENQKNSASGASGISSLAKIAMIMGGAAMAADSLLDTIDSIPFVEVNPSIRKGVKIVKKAALVLGVVGIIQTLNDLKNSETLEAQIQNQKQLESLESEYNIGGITADGQLTNQETATQIVDEVMAFDNKINTISAPTSATTSDYQNRINLYKADFHSENPLASSYMSDIEANIEVKKDKAFNDFDNSALKDTRKSSTYSKTTTIHGLDADGNVTTTLEKKYYSNDAGVLTEVTTSEYKEDLKNATLDSSFNYSGGNKQTEEIYYDKDGIRTANQNQTLDGNAVFYDSAGNTRSTAVTGTSSTNTFNSAADYYDRTDTSSGQSYQSKTTDNMGSILDSSSNTDNTASAYSNFEGLSADSTIDLKSLMGDTDKFILDNNNQIIN